MSRADDESLTTEESKAIAALRRVAARWPRSLMLASMDGELVVVRNDATRMDGPDIDQGAIVAEIDGIPNTGGGW
ncbi:hypothetical protein [[Mycobacterium] crassicus]|uniref:Uncharacterized protein n=1 Tax=[Mycobacterium] crassicus TaxID=2872309 RepID=A0ABU5XMC4_9MYCO|nr:hypothetical protein [Mycolicibacter sp. MYC098]MEB3023349.1 hypothetical protein [Mycolicibacter sp. MYC098]